MFFRFVNTKADRDEHMTAFVGLTPKELDPEATDTFQNCKNSFGYYAYNGNVWVHGKYFKTIADNKAEGGTTDFIVDTRTGTLKIRINGGEAIEICTNEVLKLNKIELYPTVRVYYKNV